MGQGAERSFQTSYNVLVLCRRLIHVGIVLNRPDQVRYPRSSTLDRAEKGR